MARLTINPGIPTPSAMPRVSLERPFNGAEDGEEDGEKDIDDDDDDDDENVTACVDSVELVIVGTDAGIAVERPEPKVGVGVAEDDPD